MDLSLFPLNKSVIHEFTYLDYFSSLSLCPLFLNLKISPFYSLFLKKKKLYKTDILKISFKLYFYLIFSPKIPSLFFNQYFLPILYTGDKKSGIICRASFICLKITSLKHHVMHLICKLVNKSVLFTPSMYINTLIVFSPA